MKIRTAVVLLAIHCIAGCALQDHVPDATPLDRGQLPAPNASVRIAGLRPCIDGTDDVLRLDTGQPVTVLVHGCRGSAGRFRALAQLFAFHGQQAVCFDYDAGDSLVRSAALLRSGLEGLAARLERKDITLIGHSMGGLVARKAVEDGERGWRTADSRIRLATVSAPFAGIRTAEHCGYVPLQWASLGIVPAICWAITGDNWREITSSSPFIREPGALMPAVTRFVKIVTDERESCRRQDETGRCVASDYIFSLEEQYFAPIERTPGLENIQVRAGHVEIVGDRDRVPRKLLAILQEQRLLAATPMARQAALERLLAELY